MEKLKHIKIKGVNMPVSYLETQQISPGVTCDVYNFLGDSSRDVGIVSVAKGSSTPLQRVLKGDITSEHFVSGAGKLVVGDKGQTTEYVFPGHDNQIDILIGQTMQWFAEDDLIFYEICSPPYQDGRFETLSNNKLIE